ncbi:MAG: hypothetical protein HXY21_03030 [Parvularculaceae bacterium]|nr:hypothetical protein [Parvularculaceae bacterium]
MTPVRALFAGLLGAVIFAAGLFIVAKAAGARPHDLAPLLSIGRTPFSLWCFLAAWGALALGALGILAAFFAFIAPEEDEDPRHRRRGFPKALPPFLIAVALALAYLALACGTKSGIDEPVALPATPASVTLGEETALLGEEKPTDEPAPPPSEPFPAEPVGVGAAAFQWRYMDPLMRDAGGVWTGASEPFNDDAEAARLLCGKAWVAVSGSASEEGPAARNEARSRLRTLRAMSRAGRFLDRRPDCGPTVVLGLDLGQHAATRMTDDGADDGGAASAYQRQILVVSRARAAGETALSAAAAEAELRAFLSRPEYRADLLAGRDFQRDPIILQP